MWWTGRDSAFDMEWTLAYTQDRQCLCHFARRTFLEPFDLISSTRTWAPGHVFQDQIQEQGVDRWLCHIFVATNIDYACLQLLSCVWRCNQRDIARAKRNTMRCSLSGPTRYSMPARYFMHYCSVTIERTKRVFTARAADRTKMRDASGRAQAGQTGIRWDRRITTDPFPGVGWKATFHMGHEGRARNGGVAGFESMIEKSRSPVSEQYSGV
jgi:hypothetical protein